MAVEPMYLRPCLGPGGELDSVAVCPHDTPPPQEGIEEPWEARSLAASACIQICSVCPGGSPQAVGLAFSGVGTCLGQCLPQGVYGSMQYTAVPPLNGMYRLQPWVSQTGPYYCYFGPHYLGRVVWDSYAFANCTGYVSRSEYDLYLMVQLVIITNVVRWSVATRWNFVGQPPLPQGNNGLWEPIIPPANCLTPVVAINNGGCHASRPYSFGQCVITPL